MENTYDINEEIIKHMTKKERKISQQIVTRALNRIKTQIDKANKKYTKKHSLPTRTSKKLSTLYPLSKIQTTKNKLKTFKSSLRLPILTNSKKTGTPYHIKMETKEYESDYHKDNLCGSTYYGLATTLQQKVRSGNLIKAIKQVHACIKSRERYTNKIGVNSSHEEAISIMIDLKDKLIDLIPLMNEPGVLENISIDFDDSVNMFVIK
jgi:hypothetical protein